MSFKLPKFKKGMIVGIVGGILIFFIIISAIFVDEGERTVITRFGKFERTLGPGLHFKIPVAEKSTVYEVRTQKIEAQASSASRDLQIVETTIALNFNIDPNRVRDVYADVQTEYMNRLIQPSIQEAVKASTAKFNAEALITQRPEVRQEIFEFLEERLDRRGIIVSDVSIVHFKFSEEFDRAIEAKVTAEQRALEAENKLKQVEFERQQRIEQATGEAEAIRIQAEAITKQGGKEYIQLQWIEAWKTGGSEVPNTVLSNDSNFLLNLELVE